jgi:hypothetical protein
MTAPDPRLGRLLLLGENYGTYGEVAATRVGSQSAAAISVGSDENSPSRRWKYDDTVANEDTLCVIDAGDWVGVAVADAHYGPESSHMLVSRLHDIWAKVRPTDLQHLEQMVEFLRTGDPARTESETTLLVSVFDREAGNGFGVSFGDSTFSVVGPGRVPTPINHHDHRFVSGAIPQSFRNGSLFRFEASPGEVLLAFTDGIDGCHYREPATSVRPQHITTIAQSVAYDPLDLITQVTGLALRGVEGNPGGQDNIAIAAITV